MTLSLKFLGSALNAEGRQMAKFLYRRRHIDLFSHSKLLNFPCFPLLGIPTPRTPIGRTTPPW